VADAAVGMVTDDAGDRIVEPDLRTVADQALDPVSEYSPDPALARGSRPNRELDPALGQDALALPQAIVQVEETQARTRRRVSRFA
jgi:hypothetical protein